MKEDYLWDKTGEDAEIQALENALKAFRFQENAPPELPQKVFALEKEKPRKFFQFGFAFAAFAAVLVVFSLAWLQFSSDKTPVGRIAANTDAVNRAEKIAGVSFVEPRGVAPVKAPENAPPVVKPNVVKIRQKSAPIVRPIRAFLRKPKIKAPPETLTAEERYAYDQLMLALSITGTQLRIVKDKIHGIENQNAALDATK